MNWFSIENIDIIDSPALVVYKERVQQNIRLAVEMVKDVSKLRPHVKTNKISEVCKMMMDVGIYKFKCATIAEAEMLAIIYAKDVLLAYQPTPVKAKRFLELVKKYPATHFSCLIDNTDTAKYLSEIFSAESRNVDVFIDLNTGMNRAGMKTADAFKLFQNIKSLPAINVLGLHAYDGHIRDTDLDARKQKSDEAFCEVISLLEQMKSEMRNHQYSIIIGGSPTFPTHVARENVECSPGTFVFWDWGYKHTMPDVSFEYAALVITRVISIVDNQTICLDIGHKSVAAENPLPRVHFLNMPEAIPVAQSEEHLVIKVADTLKFEVGDIFYGVPVHICPTVALYDKAIVIENNKAVDEWEVIARKRKITI